MDTKRCHIVLSTALHARLRRIAHAEHRSLSAQIVHYLSVAVVMHGEMTRECDELSDKGKAPQIFPPQKICE